MKKTLRKLKNRIISAMAAGILLLSPVMMPVTVYADGSTTIQSEDTSEEKSGSGSEEMSEPSSGMTEDSSESKPETSEAASEATSESASESTSELTSEKGENSSETASEPSSESTSENRSESSSEEKEDRNELHTVMSETKSSVELSVFSSLDDSTVKVNPLGVRAREEGLEVLEGYSITGKNEGKKDSTENTDISGQKDSIKDADEDAGDENLKDNREAGKEEHGDPINEESSEKADSDESEETEEPEEETLYVKAEPTGELNLQPKERVSLYSVENHILKDILIEDITGESELLEIDEDVSGIALVKDTGYRRLSLQLFPDTADSDKTIKLEGMMPKEAWAKAADVTTEYSDNSREDLNAEDTDRNGETADESSKENESEEGANADNNSDNLPKVILAYDITILDGDAKYQPGEERPVAVTIQDDRILSAANLSLWHVKDDGSREEVTDFVLEDGQIRFNATGFSVYEIDENVITKDDSSLLEKLAENGEDGYFAGIYFNSNSANTNGPYYFVGGIRNIPSQSPRTGLTVTSKITDETIPGTAVKLYFEKVSLENNLLNCYIYVKEGEEKKYLRSFTGSFGSARAGLNYANSDSEKTLFVIDDDNGNSNGRLRIGYSGYYWVADNGSNPQSVVGYTNKTDANLAWLQLVGINDDLLDLDGITYGLMYKSGGIAGYGLVADDGSGNNAVNLTSVTIRKEGNRNVVYVPEKSDITMWTFHSSGDKYILSAFVDGSTKYLKIDGSNITMTDSQAQATAFDIEADNNKEKIMLSVNGQIIYYDQTSGKFVIGVTAGDSKWLSFAKISDISDDDLITYSALKVGMSDPEIVDQKSVIVYTRVWNDSDPTNKRYDFYAIDHDGTLYPVYERGDNIMWTGDKINTLLWTFTEYHNDDGTPNYYYELQNNYSKKYLAPQISGQILSDDTIGINLPGRRDGEYFSKILAWDDPYYSYAGLKASDDHGSIVSCSRSKAEDFYFAVMDTLVPTLTTVETIDNHNYGITMKMVDYKDTATEKKNEYQNRMLGDDTAWEDHKTVPKSGILSSNLMEVPGNPDKKYPTTSSNHYLSEMYEDAVEVNHLFISSTYEATGYFEFDSCQNFATLVKDDGTIGTDFTVYKELGTKDTGKKTTLQHGQFFPYDTITPGIYSKDNTENLYSSKADPGNASVGLLPDDDPRKYEKLHAVADPNYYNGMELEASFVQTPSGRDAWGHDIIFEFTGDDDFWLYVDGELVIDLGGIHSALAGSVNFATGDVYVNGTKTSLRAVFKDNYRKRNPQATTEEVNSYLAQYFDGNETVFKDYTTHTMKIFYMERGAGASNLHMRFNLSYVTPGSVFFTKKVTGTEDLDFDLVQYPYQIWYIDNEVTQEKKLLKNKNQFVAVQYQNSTQKVEYAASYTPPGCNTSYESVYFLYPDMTAEIKFPSDTIMYRIIECGIDSDVYDYVKVNDVPVLPSDIGSETNRHSYDSGWMEVSARPDVEFENHVDPDGLRDLNFQKKVFDEDNNPLSADVDQTLFSFRLYLSNGATDDFALANMVKYGVKNPDGYLCYWDADEQKFKPSKYRDFSELKFLPGDTDEQKQQKRNEKEALTSDTSMNGTISKIPAWYTVVVPDIPVGTKFKYEERFSETPIGYGRTRYERVEGTYYYDATTDEINEGRVIATYSPQLNVVNKRGYGLQANKVWSDKAYTKWHETIYTAIYVGNSATPLEGSIREMVHPSTYVRYFIEDVVAGASIDDYRICEVKVTNPVVDEDGVVTSYSSLQKVGDTTRVKATGIDSDTTKEYTYSVSYELGTPEKSIPELDHENTRTDTITNTREGGIVFTLYDMYEPTKKLPGGSFTLERYNTETEKYEKVGSYVSDSEGRITIFYDFERNVDYRMTETESPKGYIGLPNGTVFSVDNDDNITISGNDSIWQNAYPSTASGDLLTGYVDLYNKPYTIEVYKYDGEKTSAQGALKEAYFDLYKGIEGFGGIVKDYTPLYKDLETRPDGYIPSIDTGLEPGTYYLTEKAPPDGYVGLDGDVIFEITPLGELKLKNQQTSGEYTVELKKEELNDGRTIKYYLNIPNTRDDSTVNLTVRKLVSGNMGNKAGQFSFTFETESGDTDEYQYVKKNLDESVSAGTIRHGETFTLTHGDEIKISVPIGTDVRVSEETVAADGYTTTVSVDYGTPETANSKTIESIDEDTVLTFTNTRESLIPTGVWMPVGGMVALALVIFAGGMVTVLNRRRYREYL